MDKKNDKWFFLLTFFLNKKNTKKNNFVPKIEFYKIILIFDKKTRRNVSKEIKCFLNKFTNVTVQWKIVQKHTSQSWGNLNSLIYLVFSHGEGSKVLGSFCTGSENIKIKSEKFSCHSLLWLYQNELSRTEGYEPVWGRGLRLGRIWWRRGWGWQWGVAITLAKFIENIIKSLIELNKLKNINYKQILIQQQENSNYKQT